MADNFIVMEITPFTMHILERNLVGNYEVVAKVESTKAHETAHRLVELLNRADDDPLLFTGAL